MNYERDHSHTHCFNNTPKDSPCGQPIEKHTQCCLCDIPAPKSEEPEDIWFEKELAKARQEAVQEYKDELVRAGESLKEKNKGYLFFIREHKDESIEDYQNLIKQWK